MLLVELLSTPVANSDVLYVTLYWPPDIEEYQPDAMLCSPPVTEEFSPEALLDEPPITEE